MTTDGEQPQIRLEMLSQPRLLAAVRAMVSGVAQRVGFSEVQSGQISLATDEALCNVINHGYDRRDDGPIWIKVFVLDGEPQGLTLIVEDMARQVDPGMIQSRDLDDVRPGGLGVYIIREIMDDVRYERRAEGGMRLTMTKRVPVDAEADGHAHSTSCESEPEHGSGG